MTAQIIPFQFRTTQVRTIEIDDLIWFVASDVAKALNYPEAKDMTRMLDDDEAGRHIVPIRSENGVEQDREVSIINESGLYHAILKSRKPEAVPFRKWVTNEVLPAIRKTGRFEAQPQPTIGPQDQNMLQIAVKEIAEGDGKQMAAIWSRFNNHFKLGSYKQLLPSQMPDALLYLSGLAKPDSTTLASAIHSVRIAPSDQLLELVRRNGSNWRWMLTFSHSGHADLSPVPDDANIVTNETLPDMLHQFDRDAVLEAMARMMEKLRRG